jgi:hypothetical protein
MIVAVEAERIIWMGRGEVRPLEGAHPDFANATWASAAVFVWAATAEDFDRAFRTALAEEYLELVELEAFGPLNEMLEISDALAGAFETAESGEATVITTWTDEPPDADDPDAITLRAAAESGEPAKYRLLGQDRYSGGFVVDASDTWALVHLIDRDVAGLDGYAAVRFDGLTDADVVDTDGDFIFRVLEHRGEGPIDPGVPLEDHRSILAAVAAHYPLVALGDSRRSPGEVAIGRITKVGEHAVTLRGVNTAGRWTMEHEHPYSTIERIEFGRRYYDALASILP